MTFDAQAYLNARTYSRDVTDTVPTISGRISIFDPQPDEIRIEDIAYGLARTPRYGSQTKPLVLCAEHCVLVSEILMVLYADRELALAGLLHDACEAYIQDIQMQVRRRLSITLPSGESISYDEYEDRITSAVFKRLGLNHALLKAPELKAADMMAVEFEKRTITAFTGQDWGIPPIPPEVQHLAMVDMQAEEAERAFMSKFELLTQAP